MSPKESSDGVGRRALLRGLAAGGAAASAGCVREVRSVVNREPTDQLSVTIPTVPADVDRETTEIARGLAENLEAVGVATSVDFLSVEEFYRTVLINHSFDLYVGRHPGGTDPDFLYEALHSVYADEQGWQNPFGFTSIAFDEGLERQRRLSGEARREQVADVLRGIAAEQPFVPICFPIECRLAREDRFSGWNADLLASRLGYLDLEPVETEGEDEGEPVLRGVLTDPRATQNLNPLSAEYRNRGVYVDLLYDSLGVADGEEVRPWLAETWEWDDREATIELRSDHRFHDDEPVTASDVAFTYRFLDDTSLEGSDVPAPSPRYRGLASAIEDVEVTGTRTLRFSAATEPPVAERAFTIPILPEHVWTDRTGESDFPGVDVAPGTTEAVVTDNVPPVGSGPFRFEDRTERDRLVFERVDDHFTRRDDVDLPEATVAVLDTQISPGSSSAIEVVSDGAGDVTVSALESYAVDDVPDVDGVDVLESRSETFYHVGFNVRRAPFSNPYFRRIVAGVLDKEWLVETVFDGYAEATATPIDGEWVPQDLAWNGTDPSAPFFGSDGELDVPSVRAAFRDAGFRYDDEGRLLARN